MAEVCKNGHEFTEENTLWHRDELRGRTRRRCKKCKNDFRRKDKPTVTEMSRMATTYLHEDLEDLLKFGATYEEILERGGFSDWGSMYRSLKRRERWDLIEKLREKKNRPDVNKARLRDAPNRKKQGRRRHRQGDVHDLPKEIEELIFEDSWL